MSALFSLQLEKHTLSGILNYPDVFSKLITSLTAVDFYNNTHEVIFSVYKDAYLKRETIDKTILAQKITNLGVKFRDEISIFDYIESLYFNQITPEATIKTAHELIKLRIRREICDSVEKVKKYVIENGDQEINSLINETDRIYNEKVKSFYIAKESHNLYDDIEQKVEQIANNPPDSKNFLMGPFNTINKIYGSLLRPGNINLVCARTGVAKTSLSMFYLNWVAEKYDIPILHLDFGEMLDNELQMRSVCMFTEGIVPYYAIETGKWRDNPEYTKLVRSVWPRVKKIKFYYEQVGDLNPDDIISLIRHYYFNKVGRGNLFLVNYDYLKPFEMNTHSPEWQQMGFFIKKIKALITKDVPASFWMGLQGNRFGITTNKNSNQVDDSENSFSISDRIIQQVTHAWIARLKTQDEIDQERNMFGNLKFLPMKFRHLGEEYERAIKYVKCIDGKYRRNYINLNSKSFFFEEKGDLVDMTEKLKDVVDLDTNDEVESKL